MSTLLQPLDHLLGTRSKVRLMRVLLERESGVSVREAARLAGISHHTALRALEDLEELGAIRRLETGREHLISANRRSHHVQHGLEPLFRSERQGTELAFQRLHRMVSEASHESSSEILSAMIFGSAARGRDRPQSDLDLLVVVAQEEAIEAVHRELAGGSGTLALELGLRLSPVVATLARLREQHENGGQLVQEALNDGRRVFGTHLADLLGGQA